MKTVKLDDTAMLRVAEFSILYYDSKEKQQSEAQGDLDDRDRRIEQGMFGKMAEEAVCKAWLTTKPDYTLYPRGTKMNGSPDLTMGPYRVHVKSCNPRRQDWLADPATDDIVNNPADEDIVVFCRSDTKNSEVEILGWSFAKHLTRCWLPPEREDIRRKGKKAIYWPTIQRMKTTTNYSREEE